MRKRLPRHLRVDQDQRSHLVDDNVADGHALCAQGREQPLGLGDGELRRDGHDTELGGVLIAEQVT